MTTATDTTTKRLGRPRWSSVDVATASLLSGLAGTELSASEEWDHFVAVLTVSARDHSGLVHPNAVRAELRDVVHPRRIGAFYRRALLSGLLTTTSLHELSTDLRSRNRGRPTRIYRFHQEHA